MSGLLALLDDVAAIVKLTATQLDDVAAQAAKVGGKVSATVVDDTVKAGAKAAGVVIDDAAVTPKYVTGLPAARELPIVWKIARASFFNKLVILLPIALALNAFLPGAITPLLMLGGAYLSFEGAEKIWHALHPHPESHAQKATALSAAHLEEQRVKGAIKTDFILSAEIMTIALSAVESDSWIAAGIVLAIVAVGITAIVYGAVAVLVKLDDVGLTLCRSGRFAATRNVGRWMVRSMPGLLRAISVVGTAAMLWVGGSILVHGADGLGWHWPYQTIHDLAELAASPTGGLEATVAWSITALIDGIIAICLGLILIPIVTRFVVPVLGVFFPEKQGAE